MAIAELFALQANTKNWNLHVKQKQEILQIAHV